jgi:DNA-binding MarR family transcriptional regulator
VSQPRWLNGRQQQQWRAVVRVCALLPEQLERDLSHQHGLSLAEYEVLVRLSEAPQRQMRMSDLAQATLVSRSRLSHQITRMEREGLVRRQECENDRRGWLAVLTEEGMDRLVAAAPDHVDTVRHYVVDQLTDEEFASLAKICDKLGGELEARR